MRLISLNGISKKGLSEKYGLPAMSSEGREVYVWQGLVDSEVSQTNIEFWSNAEF